MLHVLLILVLLILSPKVFGNEYRSRSSCSLLHCPVTSYLLGPNIITLFLKTLSLCFSLLVGNKVPYLYKQAKLQFIVL